MRILHRAIVATTVPAVVVLVLGTVAIYFSLQRGFLNYVSDLEMTRLEPARNRIAQEYLEQGTLDRFAQDQGEWSRVLRWRRSSAPPARRRREPRPERRPPRAERPPNRDPLELTHRVSLYDASGALLAGTGGVGTKEVRLPIHVDGAVVAQLGVRPIERLERGLEIDYMQGLRWTLLLVAALGTALSILVGVMLGRRLASPLFSISVGAREVASGRLDARVVVTGRDELGDLARDFNTMAASLADAEQGRRRWVADTSHELRTPLAVLQGELEALLDGVYAPEPARLRSLHEEVLHLGKLVDDLALLARSDRGEISYAMAEVDLAALTETLVHRHELRLQASGLQIRRELPDALTVYGDRERLIQLISNILENSRRYTDAPGHVEVRLCRVGEEACLTIEDSAPGVRPDALSRLLERFYRPDEGRSRGVGGAGLGLAICRRIAEAHGGRICVRNSERGGLAVEVKLPVLETS